MNGIICRKCGKTFNNKYNLNRHLERSLNCVNGSKSAKINYYTCNMCNRTFTRKDSLKKHNDLNRCKKTNIKINGTSKGLNNYKINGNNNNTISTNIIDSSITINLVLFGKDGIKNLTYDEINNLFKTDKNLVEFLIEVVNLNPNKPQHHNILYTNLQSAYGKAYKNDKWVSNKIDELIDIMIDAKLEDLNDILNEMVFLNDNYKNTIKKTIAEFNITRPANRKKLASYLKPILYNHKNMIIKTMKISKKQEEKIIRNQQLEAELEAEKEEQELINNKKMKKNKNIKKDKENISSDENNDKNKKIKKIKK